MSEPYRIFETSSERELRERIEELEKQLKQLNSFPPLRDGGDRRRNNGTNNGAGDSFRDTSEGEKGDRKRNEKGYPSHWLATPISELVGDASNLDWCWHGYLAPQQMTLFTGLWKCGKSTMLSLLMRDLRGERAQFCGQDIRPSNILLVTEESAIKWVERRDKLVIADHVHIICKPWLTKADQSDWIVFLGTLANQVKDRKHDLVIFDSIFNLWTVQDENDAPEVRDALRPMNMLMEEGAGIMLAAHPKKGDAGEGQATRGTGALPAFVDIITEMRRYDPEHREDTRRVLTSYSRWDETPEELVIELDREVMEYRAIGSKSDVKVKDRLAVVLEIVPAAPMAYTIEELLQNWPTNSGIVRPGEKTLRRDLDKAVQEQWIRVRGAGIRNDPNRYFRA